jgi:chemotaxis protein MotB
MRASARSLALLLVAGCLLLAAPGCVSSRRYKSVVAERDSLDRRSSSLAKKLDNAQTSNASLQQELQAVLDELEDERLARDALQGRVSTLSATERRLTEVLTYTEVELERSQEELDRKRKEVELLTSTYTNLVSDLEAELASGQIQIEQLREGLRVNVSDDVLFASGSATLDSVGREVLVKVAGQLAKLDHTIEVQGHTDNLPIRGALAKTFPTNWELAAARAARVARLLQEKGVSGDRLIVASFADNRPLVPNDSPQGRAQNRRIEIRLLPKEEPIAAVPTVGDAEKGGQKTSAPSPTSPAAPSGRGASAPAARP